MELELSFAAALDWEEGPFIAGGKGAGAVWGDAGGIGEGGLGLGREGLPILMGNEGEILHIDLIICRADAAGALGLAILEGKRGGFGLCF